MKNNKLRFFMDEKTKKDLDKLIKICHANLKNSQECISYLRDNRGLSSDTISKYGIGFFPQNIEKLTQFVSRSTLEKLNIIDFSGGSKFSDFYYLVFPIRNEYGDVIGINGRTLISEAQREMISIPKYENSSFKKSHVLFGFSRARGSILKSKNVFVSEGNFDQISLYEKGIKNAVAICGTAFSNGHFLKLAKYTDTITFVLDRDDGGKKAMSRISKKFSNRGIKLRFKNLPEGYKDVDEYFSAGHSKEEFLNSLEETYPNLEEIGW